MIEMINKLMKEIGKRIKSFFVTAYEEINDQTVEEKIAILSVVAAIGYLIYLTVLNIMYFPYLITWIAFIIPSLFIIVTSIWFLSNVKNLNAQYLTKYSCGVLIGSSIAIAIIFSAPYLLLNYVVLPLFIGYMVGESNAIRHYGFTQI